MTTKFGMAWLFALVLACSTALSQEIQVRRDPDSGFISYCVTVGDTTACIAPQAGANAYSIEVRGVEYLRQPQSLKDLPGVGYGNPVLYPTPNRVKDAAFTFEGTRVQFAPNAGPNFIHGLVNRHAWKLVSIGSTSDEVSLSCQASFAAGTELHKSFPFAHELFLKIAVRDGSVRWTYTVDNTSGEKNVPFGFALHPYFVYQGKRAATHVTIPASHWMQSDKALPSGKLVPAAELEFPLNTPLSLAGTKFDDVFWGMKPEAPTLIDFRDVDREVSIRASDAFTHLVVWTPDQAYFGIESQTCSTDAHNLHAAGLSDEAHLLICPAGEQMSGWVEYAFRR